MKKLMPLLIICLAVFALQACKKKKDPCYEATRLDGGTVVVYFFSVSDNKYMYGAEGFPSVFNKDSLQIKDQNGDRHILSWGPTNDPENPLIQISKVSWSSIMTQSEYNSSLTQEVSKDFYVRYSYNQHDTLNFRFKCRKTECDAEFDYLRVYYKSNLIKEQIGDVYTKFTVRRP